MKGPAIFLACVAAFVSGARAADADRDAVLDQLQAEFTVCTAFYTFKQTCGAAGETGRRLAASKRRAEALARAIGMTPEQTALRLEIALAADQALTGGCDGAPILESRYAAECDPFSSVPQ